MIPGRHHPDYEDLKNLVSEQNGLRWSLFAILVALFVGLAFRSTFAPEKVRALIEKAATKIHPDVHVTFENAYLSLSDGLFPELAVVVENIELQSEQNCWKQPLIKVDEIRLPLEFGELFRGRLRLSTVDVDHVEVLLRAPNATCETAIANTLTANPEKAVLKASEKSVPAGKTPTPPAASLVKTPEVEVTRRNPVENVRIRSLHFQAEGESWPEMDFRRLKIHSKAEEKELNVEGALVLPLESRAGASPQADFRIFYAPNAKEAGLDIDIGGFWREGRFHFHSSTELKEQKTSLSLDAQHLPLTEVLGMLRRQRILDRDLNGRQAWISFHAHTESPEKIDANSSLKIDRFKMEGDLGEIEAQDFMLARLSPLQPGPLTLGLRGVRLERLLNFLDIETTSPAIGDLGTFNGSLKYKDARNLELNGEHSGLQFIFSNRGVREMQTLSLISGRALLQNDAWQVDVDRVRPLDGLFLGWVKVRADRNWDKVNITVDMDELSLSPAVQRLMTSGGSLGRWSGDVQIGMSAGHVESLKGQVDAAELVVENLSIGKGQALLSTQQGHLHMDLTGRYLRLQSPSQILNALRPFLNEGPEPFESEQVHLTLDSKNFDELRWKLLPMKIGAVSLHSEGHWESDGRLIGELSQETGSEKRRWNIKGTRAVPQFEILK